MVRRRFCAASNHAAGSSIDKTDDWALVNAACAAIIARETQIRDHTRNDCGTPARERLKCPEI